MFARYEHFFQDLFLPFGKLDFNAAWHLNTTFGHVGWKTFYIITRLICQKRRLTKIFRNLHVVASVSRIQVFVVNKNRFTSCKGKGHRSVRKHTLYFKLPMQVFAWLCRVNKPRNCNCIILFFNLLHFSPREYIEISAST